MNRYQNDPRWIVARFKSACQCGQTIEKGEKAFYYPTGKTCLCEKCGLKASAEFAAAVADEAFMSGGYQ